MSILETNKDKLFLAAMLAAISIYAIDTFSFLPLKEFQALFSIFLVFFTPGYFLSSLIFHNRHFEVLERILLSLALSIAIIPTVYLAAYMLFSFGFTFQNAFVVVVGLDILFYALHKIFTIYNIELPKMPFKVL